MADKCHLCLLGLIFLSSLLTGTSGVDDIHVFISSGENVHLPCNNALPDCNSTTWIYNRFGHSETVELINLGEKKINTDNHERLTLGSDCSLNIKSIAKEDSGLYSCQQWRLNGQKWRPDAHVDLHVLHVSSSSLKTEISPGSYVTLSCQLYSYSHTKLSCVDWIHSQRIQLFWVNQAGVKLMISDTRYQISSPGHCIITLTTTLLNEDDNREWRCEVTHRDQLKTSFRQFSTDCARSMQRKEILCPGESLLFSQLTQSQVPVLAQHILRESYDEPVVEIVEDVDALPPKRGPPSAMIVIIVEFAVFAAPTVILLQIICARRAGKEICIFSNLGKS
ncbi:uncharacterized protein [Garra rufa]|uniref:uncharacterized protein n=1 Tax=Garra rufa TaxID=137080 RepID=UPI003CCE65E3